MPLYAKEALNEGNNGKRVVVCTQPRQFAATSVARYVRETFDPHGYIGGQIGYSVRFDEMYNIDIQGKKDDTGNNVTLLKYMTDGKLLSEASSSKFLRKYSCVIIDEAHERTVDSDILIGLLKMIMKIRTTDLKIIIMSATLDVGIFQEFFPNCGRLV